jgi:hypothetical protein
MTTPNHTLDLRPATPSELGRARAAACLLDIGGAAVVIRKAGAHRGTWGWNNDAVILVTDRETGERLMAARDDEQVRAVLAGGQILHTSTIPA